MPWGPGTLLFSRAAASSEALGAPIGSLGKSEPMSPSSASDLARVLVVDDDRLIRELVRDALEGVVRVECCDSAEAALDALAREPAELVLSDLTMPGLSGVELLERLRREHPGTDFALFTGNATIDSAVSALRMGAVDYLRKPLRAEELSLVVERILARRRLLLENERLREAVDTLEACQTLMRCLDPGEVYAVALDLVLHSLGRERGLALFRRTSIPSSDGAAFRGFDEPAARALRGALVDDKGFDLESFDDTRIVSKSPVHESLAEAGVVCDDALIVPLRGREREAGVMWVFAEGRDFGADDIERTRIIASYAEVALHNAERYYQAKERAFIDDVTEVYNARFLLQASEHEVQRAARYEKPLSVLFLDLDRFKLVNDQYGHLIGSQTLRKLSQVLSSCIRQIDTLARYGGDEFTILLIDTTHEAGLAVAERIRRTVAETPFEGEGGEPIHLTISVGVSTFPGHGRDRTELLDKADKAMYRAKSHGRNCVCSAAELGE